MSTTSFPAYEEALRRLRAHIALQERGLTVLRGDAVKLPSLRPPVKLAVIEGGRA